MKVTGTGSDAPGHTEAGQAPAPAWTWGRIGLGRLPGRKLPAITVDGEPVASIRQPEEVMLFVEAMSEHVGGDAAGGGAEDRQGIDEAELPPAAPVHERQYLVELASDAAAPARVRFIESATGEPWYVGPLGDAPRAVGDIMAILVEGSSSYAWAADLAPDSRVRNAQSAWAGIADYRFRQHVLSLAFAEVKRRGPESLFARFLHEL